LSALVDNAIAEFHKQTAMLSNPNRAVLDMVAADIWKGPGVANFPLKGLHAARQLGFLSHVNARVQISTSGKWQRLITPAGQLFFDTQPARPKLRVI
jgi:hypothetical protein